MYQVLKVPIAPTPTPFPVHPRSANNRALKLPTRPSQDGKNKKQKNAIHTLYRPCRLIRLGSASHSPENRNRLSSLASPSASSTVVLHHHTPLRRQVPRHRHFVSGGGVDTREDKRLAVVSPPHVRERGRGGTGPGAGPGLTADEKVLVLRVSRVAVHYQTK